MALLTTKDNVCEVSSTKGVASFILGGAIKGSQSFATAYPSGAPVYYFAREFTLTKEVGIMWEIGIGTLTGGTLSRDTVISSSDGTSKVQFPGPVTQIYSIVPLSTLVTDINAIDTAASIHAAPNKATPVGADEIGIWDSVTQLLGKVSFTNMATYFAGLCSAGWNASTAVSAVTQANGDNTTLIATDAFVQAALAYYNTPIAWNGSTDRVLGVGQHTSDSFSAQTSMPLHIACGDGQVYEIEIVGSYTPAAATAGNPILKPNNSTPATNSFDTQYGVQTQATIVGNFSVAGADNGFLLSAGQASLLSAQATIFTSTATKRSSTHFRSYNTAPNYASGWIDSTWNDTTTPYTSIGTVIMPNAWTGTITVRRVS